MYFGCIVQPTMLYFPLKGKSMTTLHVRSVPDNLYERIRKLAEMRNRSISAQVITLVERALEDEERLQSQVKVLKSIRRRRFTLPKGTPASLDLLREDRKR